jgi:hypothetical protein
MTDEKLIDPAWLVRARKNRRTFVLRTAVVFSIISMLAWWALPRLEAEYCEFLRARLTQRTGRVTAEPGLAWLLVSGAGAFRVFWGAIAVGCAVAVVLALTGKIDSFLPVLNLGMVVLGLAAVALTFYVYYAPTLLLAEKLL